MTIDEAMTDLSIQREVKRRLGEDYQADALQLGIEALKRLKKNREGERVIVYKVLPGETEEIKER